MSGKRYYSPTFYFPNLNETNHVITSPAIDRYNCYGWAVGLRTRIDYTDPDYWPEDIPQHPPLDGLIEVYKRHGFFICKKEDLEDGCAAIALYAYKEGKIYCPMHAARLKLKGKFKGQWASKMGPNEDLVHTTLEALENEKWFGSVIHYFKKKREAPSV